MWHVFFITLYQLSIVYFPLLLEPVPLSSVEYPCIHHAIEFDTRLDFANATLVYVPSPYAGFCRWPVMHFHGRQLEP